MSDDVTLRCPATTRVKRGFTGNHTLRCDKPEGHDGAHEHKAELRSTIWFGEARPMPTDTRWRNGFIPNWQHH